MKALSPSVVAPPVAKGGSPDARTPRRSMVHGLALAAAATLLAGATAGCGQRGPLKLPDRATDASAVSPAASTPAPADASRR